MSFKFLAVIMTIPDFGTPFFVGYFLPYIEDRALYFLTIEEQY